MLLPGLPKRRKPAVIWGVSAAAAVALTASISIPIMAQPNDARSGDAPVAIDALSDANLYNDAIVVSQDAPLNAFGGTGKELAIDGRPIGMLDGAAESSEDADADSEFGTTLLAGEVGALGELPGDLQLMHPVTTRRISSPYGWRSNPTGAGNQIHIGQDYPIACGSPVYASEAGTVVVSGWAGHSGMRVTIDHGFNVQTGYSHNSKLIAKVGQHVEQGELIALAGTTGNSTGCHVHFEVIINGRWHDPRNYLPRIPGQRDAMIDSTRLTVDAKSAPRGNGNQNPQHDEDRSTNPDVVVPKDDTPVVPSPTPTKKPKPSEDPTQSADPSPSEDESGSPSPSESESQTPDESPSTEPESSSPEDQAPSSPEPSDESPQAPSSPEESESDTEPAPSTNDDPAPTSSAPKSSEESGSQSPKTSESQSESTTPAAPSTVVPEPTLTQSTDPSTSAG